MNNKYLCDVILFLDCSNIIINYLLIVKLIVKLSFLCLCKFKVVFGKKN